jgi:predicted DNA-binding protein YlxM (UPF0122 family)
MNMSPAKFKISLKPIDAEITKARKKLQAIEPQLPLKKRKKIKADIKKLAQIARSLPCRRMTASY